MCGAPIPPPFTQGLLRRLKMLGSVYEQVKSEALENDEENNESRIIVASISVSGVLVRTMKRRSVNKVRAKRRTLLWAEFWLRAKMPIGLVSSAYES